MTRRGQIVAMTHPLIGHYGPNLLNEEKVGIKNESTQYPKARLQFVFFKARKKTEEKR